MLSSVPLEASLHWPLAMGVLSRSDQEYGNLNVVYAQLEAVGPIEHVHAAHEPRWCCLCATLQCRSQTT